MKIFNYSFLIDGSIPVSRLANTKAAAIACLKRLMGSRSKLEFVGEKFSHNVGDFETTAVTKKKVTAAMKKVSAVKSEPKKEGFDSVVEAYGRHSEVKL